MFLLGSMFTFVCVTVDPGNIQFAVRGCAVTSRTPVSRQLRLGGEVQWPVVTCRSEAEAESVGHPVAGSTALDRY